MNISLLDIKTRKTVEQGLSLYKFLKLRSGLWTKALAVQFKVVKIMFCLYCSKLKQIKSIIQIPPQQEEAGIIHS